MRLKTLRKARPAFENEGNYFFKKIYKIINRKEANIN